MHDIPSSRRRSVPYVVGYLSAIHSRPGDDWSPCPHRRGSWRWQEWHKGAWQARDTAHKLRMARRRRDPV
jgi:hypothetical protein